MKKATKNETSKKPLESGNASKPVSLAPLSFEEALSGLLQVPPSKVKEAERELDQPMKRTAKKKR